MTHTRKRRHNRGFKNKPVAQRYPWIGKCKDCQQEIMWVLHVGTGKPAPMDLHRNPDADLKVDGPTYRILKDPELTLSRERGAQLFMNHLRVCPTTHEGLTDANSNFNSGSDQSAPDGLSTTPTNNN